MPPFIVIAPIVPSEPLAKLTVPAEIFEPPEYVLAPDKVTVPVPLIPRENAPETMLEIDREEPLETLKLPLAVRARFNTPEPLLEFGPFSVSCELFDRKIRSLPLAPLIAFVVPPRLIVLFPVPVVLLAIE